MTNKFDINNTFDPDDENQAPKVSKEIASKLPTPAKGVDHYLRRTDTDPKAAKRAERQVAALFGASSFFTLVFFVPCQILGHQHEMHQELLVALHRQVSFLYVLAPFPHPALVS